MAVITKFFIVRDGIELDRVFGDKKEAEAYDKMLDAAEQLALLIKESDLQINIDARTIDEIAICLAKNGPEVINILKGIKTIPSKMPSAVTEEAPATQPAPAEAKPQADKKPGRGPKKI